MLKTLLLSAGSSPRMRGKHMKRLLYSFIPGLIPAHAGKTWPRRAPRLRREAHPRACGENVVFRPTAPVIRGSSPRMRGKRIDGGGQRGCQRLIPAHAGKTSASAMP